MARFGDADFGNSKRIPFTTQAEGSDTSYIGLEGKHDKIIDGAEIVTRHGCRDIAISPLAICSSDGRKRGIEPCIGTPCTNFRFSNRGKVLIHAPFIC